ncbi:MAG: type II toxin-antitoxin system RelE/ParE family toxin [Candidatus Aenigmatarchaeota archaeon]|nr:MAG: type II toxin-antitoxin system RelE/ParE family toxin [Candidatus Aenigmarchaeota archaeon]
MTYEVRFITKDLEKAYDSLKKIDPVLHKSITKAIDKLKVNRRAGQKIPKEQVSKTYSKLYGTEHFWKLKLSREWRLIYTIAGDQIRILTIILNWYTDHKQYRKEVYK